MPHARPSPKLVPNISTYLCVDLGARGEHHFRVPSVLTGARLLKAVDTEALGGLMAMAATDLRGQPMALLGVLRTSGPETIALAGFLLGVAWYHEQLALDTTIDEAAPLVTGEAVIEELHEAGYSLGELVVMAVAVANAWAERNTVSAEVAARTSFFGHPTDSMSSSSSTSGSGSSAIPGASVS